jgi:hypothetical protein
MTEIPLSSLLHEFMKKNNHEREYQEVTAVELFKQLLPEQYRAMIQRVSVKNGILYVKSNSASLSFELMNQRSVFIQQINQKLGEAIIRDILFS